MNDQLCKGDMKTQTKSILQVVCPIHKCTLKSLHTYAQETIVQRKNTYLSDSIDCKIVFGKQKYKVQCTYISRSIDCTWGTTVKITK